jgi:pyrroline-5-carboxylate reductase
MIVGFAGAGNMAAAIARGWAGADGGPEQMLFCDVVPERATALAGEVNGEAVDDLGVLADRSELLLLAVKPAALDDVAGQTGSARAVLSILAATPLGRVEEAYPGASVFRVMPNQAVSVHLGTLCLAVGQHDDPELTSDVRSLLGLLGTVVDLDDALFDAATAVMSSTPAYFAVIAEAIADAGAREGLDADLSHRMVAETMLGTGALLREHHAVEVRELVASPKGATEAGLDALAGAAAAGAFVEAVEASLERMRKL